MRLAVEGNLTKKHFQLKSWGRLSTSVLPYGVDITQSSTRHRENQGVLTDARTAVGDPRYPRRQAPKGASAST